LALKDLERLSRRTGCASSSRIRHSTRSPLAAHAQQIRRVDNRLALQALHVVKGLADSAAMDRHDHGFGVRDVPALSPDPPHLLARPLLEISERATDIAIAYHGDLHFTSSSSLGSRAQLVVRTTPAYWKRKPCPALLYTMSFALGCRCDMAQLPNAWIITSSAPFALSLPRHWC
jgi:hypothetical protein